MTLYTHTIHSCVLLQEATEKLIEKKLDQQELTPWEQYLKKKKDKRKQKRLEWKEAKVRRSEPHLPFSRCCSSHIYGDCRVFEIFTMYDVTIQEQSKAKDDDLVNDDDIPSDVDLNDPYFRDALKDTDEENESMANFKSVQTVF